MLTTPDREKPSSFVAEDGCDLVEIARRRLMGDGQISYRMLKLADERLGFGNFQNKCRLVAGLQSLSD